MKGDFNGNGLFDVEDADRLTDHVRRSPSNDIVFDLDGDGRDLFSDLEYWVKEIGNIYFGDANVDGVFDSNDLIQVLANNEYEDAIRRNSVWSEGDWNGNGDFTADDLMLALDDGGYEMGPRPQPVPEPASFGAAACRGLVALRRHRRF